MDRFSSLFFQFVSVVTAVLVFTVIYFKRCYIYWKTHGVPHPNPTVPFGNFRDFILQRKNFGEVTRDIYKKFKNCGKIFIGVYIFTESLLVPIDLELIKCVLTRDFHHFMDRGTYTNEKTDPLSGTMFLNTGTKWKNLRNQLSSTFTSGKMKMMFPILMAVTKRLLEVIEEKVRLSEPIDIKDTMARFTTDTIGSCAFGLESNCLQKPDDELRKCGKRFFEISTIRDAVRSICVMASPRLMKLLGIKFAPPEVDNFFRNVVKNVVSYRECNKVERKDFMQLLLQLKNYGRLTDSNNDEVFENDIENAERLTVDQIAAQSFGFFIGGFETSSSTLSFLFYELVKHPEIQEKVREEILRVLKTHKEDFTYEALMEMTYLDQVVAETLRKYPIFPVLNRECTEDYLISGTKYIIKKGQKVLIPVMGLHYDPQYYPDPEKFDPDRFNEENKASRHPYTYLPFGEGPRFCIGKRFGLMQTKIGVAVVLRHYKLVLNAKTKEPLEINPKTIATISPKNVILLDVMKV